MKKLIILFLILLATPAMALVPAISIDSPATGTIVNGGGFVNFVGSATDPDGAGIKEQRWTSSIDGVLGTGNPVGVATLSVGIHTIDYTVTDNDNEVSVTSITLEIRNTAPSITIDRPINGDVYGSSAYITFQATATDPEDGVIPTNKVVWTSSIDGEFATDNGFTFDGLTVGNHTITVTATDGGGLSDADTISITVQNTKPTVSMITPGSGDTYNTRQFIQFSGTATDNEDLTVPASSITWFSSLDGNLGTGNPLSLDTLQPGTHTITMTAVDSDGATSDPATASITVTNAPPVVNITAPTTGSSFEFSDTIVFTATATDAEDGPLPNSAYEWTSDRNGPIGTGPTFSTAALIPGLHLITLTVTDSDGAITTQTIQITAGNHPPVAVIRSPRDGDKFLQGDTITFHGTANDLEDGPITAAGSLSWTSSQDGPLGTGTILNTASLSPGLHEITLRATDSLGAWHEVRILITCGNTPPVATILKPEPSTLHETGAPIIFNGSGSDAEDGVLPDASLVWTVNNGGLVKEIGTGTSFQYSGLTSGPQTITLTVTDSGDAEAQDSVDITIAPFVVSPSSITLARNETEVVTITGGTGPFEMANEYPQVASARVADRTLTIIGKNVGETLVTLTDKAFHPIPIPVWVTEESGVPPVIATRLDPTIAREGDTVTISAVGTTSPNAGGSIADYYWEQIVSAENPPIAIPRPHAQVLQFMAPKVSGSATLRFRLTATDNQNRKSTRIVSIPVINNGIPPIPDTPAEALTIQSTKGKPIGFMATEGLTRFQAISDTGTSSINKPALLPYGLIDLERTVTPGAQACFVIFLPEAAPQNAQWYKHHRTDGWVPFMRNGGGDGAEFNADRTQVCLYVTDDSKWDDDPTPGIVRDPSGLGIPPTPTSSGGSAGGGGGGCFIDAL